MPTPAGPTADPPQAGGLQAQPTVPESIIAAELRLIPGLELAPDVCAGGGSWYSRTLGLLEPGARVWVNVPSKGYVGVGRVTEVADLG